MVKSILAGTLERLLTPLGGFIIGVLVMFAAGIYGIVGGINIVWFTLGGGFGFGLMVASLATLFYTGGIVKDYKYIMWFILIITIILLVCVAVKYLIV